MDSMICGSCPSSNAQLQIFALQQFRFGLGGEVVLVVMPGLLEVAQLHDPKLCGRVVIAILPH